MKVKLTRKLQLEERTNLPDGKGGFTVNWQVLGALWANVDARSGREAMLGERDHSRVRYRIIVRGAPIGEPSRPRPDQRFREGSRVYSILAVSELDPMGRYLECWAEEGKG